MSVDRLTQRGTLNPGSELFGKAFENWIFHELSAFISYHAFNVALSYWRLPSGIEVDFIIGDMQVAIEAKSSSGLTNHHMKSIRSLIDDHPDIERRIVVCNEPTARTTEDGIEILPAADFIQGLWNGDIVDRDG